MHLLNGYPHEHYYLTYIIAPRDQTRDFYHSAEGLFRDNGAIMWNFVTININGQLIDTGMVISRSEDKITSSTTHIGLHGHAIYCDFSY